VISAGVIMNGIFAIIFFLVAFKVGVQMHVPAVGEVLPESPAATAASTAATRSSRSTASGRSTSWTWGSRRRFADERGLDVVVRRRGKLLAPIHVVPRRELGKEYQQLGITPMDEVARVEPGGAAEKAGIRERDWIIGMNGKPLLSRGEYETAVYDPSRRAAPARDLAPGAGRPGTDWSRSRSSPRRSPRAPSA